MNTHPFQDTPPDNPRVRAFMNRLRGAGKSYGSPRVIDKTEQWSRNHREKWQVEKLNRIAVKVWAESFMDRHSVN